MANSVELAAAYVSLIADTRKLVKDINSAFDGYDGRPAGRKIVASVSQGMTGGNSAIARAGADAAGVYERNLQASIRGERIGTAIGTVIGKGIGAGIKVGIAGAAAAATGAVALLSTTLTKGFQRLQTIDQASFKLQALGHSADEVKQIMASATNSVKGTAFSMADAANAAASATAAGIKPGKQLDRYLSSVADSAAVANTSFDEMANIYNKVTAANKAYTDDLQMLQERGLPIFPWLQEQFGVTADQLQKMVEDGKVSAEDFQKAIDAHIGGAAQKMGQSFSGAVDNMETAMARLGANFLTAIFGGDSVSALAGPTEAVNKITEKFNDLERWVQNHQGDIKGFFSDLSTAAKEFGDVIGPPLKLAADTIREYPQIIPIAVAAFAGFKAIDGIASLITSLKTISTLLRVTLPADAAVGAAGVNRALAGIAVALPGVLSLIDQLNSGSGHSDPLTAGSLIAGGALAGSRFGIPGAVIGTAIGTGAAVTPTLVNGAPAPPPNQALPQGYPAAPGTLGPGFRPGERGGLTPRDPGYRPPSASGAPEAAPSHRNDPNFTGAGAPGGPTVGGGQGLPTGAAAAMPAGLTGNKGVVYSAMLQAGFPASEWGALQNLLNGESGFQNNVKNPSSTAYGMFQFLDSTWATVGGSKTSDPALQAQYGLQYIRQRYGSPSAAWAFWQSQSPHWYATGGPAIGPGGPKSDKIPAMLSNGEHVWTAAEVNAVGGQANMYRLRSMALAGMIPGFSEGGPVSLEDLLKLDTTDPLATQHGMGQGAAPGPTPDQLQQLGQALGGQQDGPQSDAPGRTQGYIPAAAGSTSVAGTSFLSGIYGMGAEFINGIIDQAANAASQAAGAAATVFAPGSGGAASGLTSAAISMGTQAAKRGVEYGAQMLGIGTDALIEQLTPFGAPRILTTDVTGFMPQQAIMSAATTSIEKAFQQGNQPPGEGPQQHQGTGAPPGPPPATPGEQQGPFGPVQPPLPGPPPPPQTPAPQPQDPNMIDPLQLLTGGVYDSGGWLPPGGVAVNLGNKPEPVLSPSQWSEMAASAAFPAQSGAVYNIYPKDTNEAIRALRNKERLDMMTHAGRP